MEETRIRDDLDTLAAHCRVKREVHLRKYIVFVLQYLLLKNSETDQQDKKKLARSLAKKEEPTEGCNGRNGEREKSSGQKKISGDNIKIQYLDRMQRLRGRRKIEKLENAGFIVKGILWAETSHPWFLSEPPVTNSEFKDVAPGVALPPKPTIARWRTWISAVVYYTSNFASLSMMVSVLEDEESSITAANNKKLLGSTEVKNDVTFIAAELSFLPEVVILLQEREQFLWKSLKIM
ncbi:hypothetical protein ANN_15582 [Periplaneta americana]|uniref:Uncharacterized protein n=1 Tax=Periplaneta americana TaxID=6978 RepID=A0ABQ8SH09_PERAM|nr:hypothetical protein ANN_15582 [Periplaneta americana]